MIIVNWLQIETKGPTVLYFSSQRLSLIMITAYKTICPHTHSPFLFSVSLIFLLLHHLYILFIPSSSYCNFRDVSIIYFQVYDFSLVLDLWFQACFFSPDLNHEYTATKKSTEKLRELYFH